ncbi:Dpse\GA26569-PA-like protein [Anopheles sinensis]|uniref:Dpse\GA26569-PA-like protein n=1 Tax=Anopheles sinensis TaxID=74873 RepID=A0A084WPP8_ANOSI|nr:Dpse\GA26569-PA-like protein [Anopheles sinensis]
MENFPDSAEAMDYIVIPIQLPPEDIPQPRVGEAATTSNENAGPTLASSASSERRTSSNNSSTLATPNVSENTHQPNVPRRSSTDSDINTLICPICFESLMDRKVLVTVCGHLFCELCIRTAREKVKKCPICQKRNSERQLHPVYLSHNRRR